MKPAKGDRCGRLITTNGRRCKRLPAHPGRCDGYYHRAAELDGRQRERGVPLGAEITRDSAIAELVAAANEVRSTQPHSFDCTHRRTGGCVCGLWRLSAALDTLAELEPVTR